MYKTTIYITNPEGISIDLGNTSAYINGLRLSGKVLLQQGYSVFETAETNYLPVATGATKLSDLRKLDSLYPYNHKLLIEGYSYIDNFKGEQLYQGVDEYFGSLLTYVPPETFAIPENTNNYDIYTIDVIDIGSVFKVKVDKSNGTWQNETYDYSWSVGRSTSNQLWFKLILSSSEDYKSAVVSSVKVRVV